MNRTPKKMRMLIEEEEKDSMEKTSLHELNQCSLFTIDEEEVQLEKDDFDEIVNSLSNI